MHILAGRTSRNKLEEMETTYIENLRFAAERLQKVVWFMMLLQVRYCTVVIDC